MALCGSLEDLPIMLENVLLRRKLGRAVLETS